MSLFTCPLDPFYGCIRTYPILVYEATFFFSVTSFSWWWWGGMKMYAHNLSAYDLHKNVMEAVFFSKKSIDRVSDKNPLPVHECLSSKSYVRPEYNGWNLLYFLVFQIHQRYHKHIIYVVSIFVFQKNSCVSRFPLSVTLEEIDRNPAVSRRHRLCRSMHENARQKGVIALSSAETRRRHRNLPGPSSYNFSSARKGRLRE